MRTALKSSYTLAPPRLVPLALRPVAALLVTAVYGAALVRLPAPTPAVHALATAEVMVLPPGDPRQELASVGSPEAAAAQASDDLEQATVVDPSGLPKAAAAEPVAQPTSAVEAQQVVEEPQAVEEPQTAMLQAEVPVESVDAAVTIAPRDLPPAERAPQEIEAVTPAPEKRETVTPTEVRKHEAEKPRRPAKPKSASSRAQQGQAGFGGGERHTSGQSIAAYGSHVRSVLVARTQRIHAVRGAGQVHLTFTIDRSGGLASYSIRSSDSAEVERAVRAVIGGATFRPPPNGRFAGSITITVR